MGRGGKIVGSIVLMAVVIAGVGELLRSRDDGGMRAPDHRAPMHDGGILAVIQDASSPLRADPHNASLSPTMQPRPGVSQRTLAAFYARRAYAGAPPLVPHPVDPTFNRTQDCNVCHEKGGYTPKFNAYVPVTPHPEYVNCLQCHAQTSDYRGVEAATATFVDEDWMSVRPPALRRPALPGNPPAIPHELQLRDQCLSCHAGPAAVADVRTSHPERVNCQQCHVRPQTQGLFSREGTDG